MGKKVAVHEERAVLQCWRGEGDVYLEIEPLLQK